jgi:DUF1009 family protein
MSGRVAVIAGSGRFPFLVAREAKRQGLWVIGFGITGWADPSLESQVDAYEELHVGQLGRLLERLASHRISQAVMAGKVTKAVLLDPRSPLDDVAKGVVGTLTDFSVGTVLGAIGRRLGESGVTLLDSSTFLRHDLCPEGVLTARGPTPEEQRDITLGLQAARAMAALDIGQTVVVKRQVVVAVEALEGTDAAIRRAHELADGGLVVVKTASPGHDRRFDLPVIGSETIATLLSSGVGCVAVEAGSTLLLDRNAVIAAANAINLCLVGVKVPTS